jgi:hypothetical protein
MFLQPEPHGRSWQATLFFVFWHKWSTQARQTGVRSGLDSVTCKNYDFIKSLLKPLLLICKVRLLQFGCGVPPKCLCVTGVVPSGVLLGSGGSFERWDLVGGLSVIGGLTYTVIVGPTPSSSCLFLLLSHELSGFSPSHVPAMLCCFTTTPNH